MSEQNYMPVKGVDMLYYGTVTADTAEGYTGATPKRIPGLVEIGFNTNPQTGTFWADNGPYASAADIGETEVTISCADLPPSVRAEILGQGYDNTTGVYTGGSPVPPYIFIQYRLQKFNGAYRYVTVLKAIAAENSRTNTTYSGSINAQTFGITCKAVKSINYDALYRIL